MLRSIQEEIVRWKEHPERRPLLLRGARQVGKTFAVRQFAEACFDNCVELNFELHPQLKSVFASLDPTDIVRTIALTRNITITQGQTLLFLDEIQECPQAYYQVIGAGYENHVV